MSLSGMDFERGVFVPFPNINACKMVDGVTVFPVYQGIILPTVLKSDPVKDLFEQNGNLTYEHPVLKPGVRFDV
jgi:hypothetical protein